MAATVQEYQMSPLLSKMILAVASFMILYPFYLVYSVGETVPSPRGHGTDTYYGLWRIVHIEHLLLWIIAMVSALCFYQLHVTRDTEKGMYSWVFLCPWFEWRVKFADITDVEPFGWEPLGYLRMRVTVVPFPIIFRPADGVNSFLKDYKSAMNGGYNDVGDSKYGSISAADEAPRQAPAEKDDKGDNGDNGDKDDKGDNDVGDSKYGSISAADEAPRQAPAEKDDNGDKDDKDDKDVGDSKYGSSSAAYEAPKQASIETDVKDDQDDKGDKEDKEDKGDTDDNDVGDSKYGSSSAAPEAPKQAPAEKKDDKGNKDAKDAKDDTKLGGAKPKRRHKDHHKVGVGVGGMNLVV